MSRSVDRWKNGLASRYLWITMLIAWLFMRNCLGWDSLITIFWWWRSDVVLGWGSSQMEICIGEPLVGLVSLGILLSSQLMDAFAHVVIAAVWRRMSHFLGLSRITMNMCR